MKKYTFTAISILAGLLFCTSCITMMDNAQDVDKIAPITVSYKVTATTDFVPSNGVATPDPSFPVKGLKAVFTNFSEGLTAEGIVDEDGVASVSGLIPGVYTIDFSGISEKDGKAYYLNGAAQNIALYRNVSKTEAMADNAPAVNIRPARVGSVCFTELYYCGIDPYYFRDQTYQIYNNGDEDFDLAGLCFAHLHPNGATATLPVYPEADGIGNFVYATLVWQIPQDKTYILKPGESIVIAQEARDHTKDNPNSFNNTIAEWETWTKTPARDTPSPNLPHIFNTAALAPQWLSTVNGSAFCLYKAPEGTVIDEDYYLQDGHWQQVVGLSARYAKIPADYVLDGVELLPSMSELNKKRIPGFVDAGAASVEGTYIGKCVTRKVIDKRADGTPIYQDTNNSTNDFVINDHPVLRRNGEKMPSWNWSNTQSK